MAGRRRARGGEVKWAEKGEGENMQTKGGQFHHVARKSLLLCHTVAKPLTVLQSVNNTC